ncbi:nicotinamide riboside kinase [Aeromonas sp. BIGb0405]|uniref:hypothetical protein n=1 Tax=Aeromonas sp. BIGb0405 TaxID=2940592 RepID=UPI002167680A|nr:hypothetical protein [Aeromonas sp. BIGb0405]MCS3455803.1 nicotinamide riboside kinase [Aeromonas sp. BIGb0405]
MKTFYIIQDKRQLMAIEKQDADELEAVLSDAVARGQQLVADAVVASDEGAAVKAVKMMRVWSMFICLVGLLNIGFMLMVQETPFNVVMMLAIAGAFIWVASSFRRTQSDALKTLLKHQGNRT